MDEDKIKYFDSINFILSEESKRRLNLLYFCIKYGFRILIPGPTRTEKLIYLRLSAIYFIKYNKI